MVSRVVRDTETSPIALSVGDDADCNLKSLPGTEATCYDTERNPDMMRSAEAARYLDMSDSWLRQTRMAGRTHGPPFVRQGRAIRYRRGDLDRWLEQRL